jgi:hypothetical protein
MKWNLQHGNYTRTIIHRFPTPLLSYHVRRIVNNHSKNMYTAPSSGNVELLRPEIAGGIPALKWSPHLIHEIIVRMLTKFTVNYIRQPKPTTSGTLWLLRISDNFYYKTQLELNCMRTICEIYNRNTYSHRYSSELPWLAGLLVLLW